MVVSYFGGETYNLSTLLDQYPHLHYEDGVLSFYGVLYDTSCNVDDQIARFEQCFPQYEEECPGTFQPEIIPNQAGCLGSPMARTWHIRTRTVGPGFYNTSPPEDLAGRWMPSEHGVDGIRVPAFGVTASLQDFMGRYPYIYFEGKFAYFDGTLMSDVCSANDVYYETACIQYM